MPASCAKALRPTIALFGCTSKPVMADEQLRDVAGVACVLMLFLQRNGVVARADRHHGLFQRGVAGALADAVDGGFHLAHAGANGGQRVGDAPGPDRCGCAWTGSTLSMPGHALAHHGEDARHVLGQRVADGVGDVDRGGAGVDRGLDAAAQEVGVGAGAVLGRPLDVIGVAGARASRCRRSAASTSSGSMRSLYFMCSALVAMKMWMRLRFAARTASAARSDVSRPARARPQITGVSSRWPMVSAIALTLSKSPGEAIGKPASITSTPSSVSASAMRIFSLRFIEKPGDCSPSRSVVSKMMMRSSSSLPKLGWFDGHLGRVLGFDCTTSASGVPLSEAGVQRPGAALRGG